MDEKTFWKLSWTWGIIMTLIGKAVFSVLQLLGYKSERNQYGYIIKIGERWGGVSMGPYCLCEKNCDDNYKKCWLKYFNKLKELKENKNE